MRDFGFLCSKYENGYKSKSFHMFFFLFTGQVTELLRCHPVLFLSSKG